MIRIIIADDQPVIRDGLKFIIEQKEEFKVVGCAGNGIEAFELCKSLNPDIVLMDIVMPLCDGVEGTSLIKTKYPDIKIIILTTFSDEEKIAFALKNGASGYVLKDIESDELLLTIKSIHKGLRVLHETAYNVVLKNMAKSELANTGEKDDSPEFTRREIDINRLIVYGKSNKQIASNLYLSEGSVRNMISAILSKAGLKDRTQLAVFAMRKNIV